MCKNLPKELLWGIGFLGLSLIAFKVVKSFEVSKVRYNNYVSGLSNGDVLKLRYYERKLR